MNGVTTLAVGAIARGSKAVPHGYVDPYNEDVKTMQKRMQSAGIDPGPIDGLKGPLTRAAMRKFETRTGKSATEGLSVDPSFEETTGKMGRDQANLPGSQPSGISLDGPGAPGGTDDGPVGDIVGVSPEQLARLGETDKAKFFAVLKPAAVEAEKKYGVPWQVTLAQVALESGWGKHMAAAYNVFGIKGNGPAGSTNTPTHEYRNGRMVGETAKFAAYHDFGEAMDQHGKLFHNGRYDKAISGFQQDHSPERFARNINGIYATAPNYADMLIQIMHQHLG